MDGYQIIEGDCLDVLRRMPSESVQCCVTSPPYFGLRDYGTAAWDGGNADCDHQGDGRFYSMQGASSVTSEAFSAAGDENAERLKKARWREKGNCIHCGAVRVDKQIGLEPTPFAFIESLVEVFREVRRVLKDDGTLWLNLGDTYSAHKDCKSVSQTLAVGTKNESAHVISKGMSRSRDSRMLKANGFKNKDLMMIPHRVAIALQMDGWYVRSDIVWHKPNPMPESVTDRPTKSHEYIFLLTKSAKYYYDAEAIKEPLKDTSVTRLIDEAATTKAVRFGGNKYGDNPEFGGIHSGNEWKPKGRDTSNGNRNGKGKSTLDARPHGIVRDRLLNYDSKESLLRPSVQRGGFEAESELPQPDIMANKKSVWTVTTQPFKDAHFATFPPKLIEPCILAGSREGDTVLDPFNGAGTTGLVSLRHRRNYIGIELNPEYIKIAEKRLSEVQVKLF